jgi:SAM-dependent methyltransferase
MSGYADEYASVEEGHWWFAGRRAVILAALRRFAPAGSRLLDVGCGTGGLTAALGERYRVEGVDPSEEAVAIARARGLRATVMRLDASLPSGFDVACALDVLEHVDDDLALAGHLARAVRPGGKVLITVPAFQALWGPMDERAGHRRRYRRRMLEAVMTRAGLRPLHSGYFNTLLFPAMALARLAGFPRAGRELERPPTAVNAALRAVFTAEAPLAARVPLPVGGSILFVGAVDG